MIRIIYTNNFDQTGVLKQYLQVFSLNSNVTINAGQIAMNNYNINPKILPIADENISIILVDTDVIMIKGL